MEFNNKCIKYKQINILCQNSKNKKKTKIKIFKSYKILMDIIQTKSLI